MVLAVGLTVRTQNNALLFEMLAGSAAVYVASVACNISGLA
jgi:hypothetical protein